MDLLGKTTYETETIYIKQEPDSDPEELDIEDHVLDDPCPDETIHDILTKMPAKVKKKHDKTNSARFKCPRCDRSYKHKYHWHRHKDQCGQPSKFHCEHCSFATKAKSSVLRHLQSFHSGRAPTIRRLRQFFQKPVDGPPLPFKCPNCDKSYIHKYALERHMAIECSLEGYDKIEMDITCEIPPDNAYTEVTTQKFVPVKVKEEPSEPSALPGLACPNPQCLRRYKNRCHMLRHYNNSACSGKTRRTTARRSTKPEAVFQCEHCSFVSKFKGSLRKHLERYHSGTKPVRRPCQFFQEPVDGPPLPFKCPNCDKSYIYKYALERHVTIECSLADDHTIGPDVGLQQKIVDNNNGETAVAIKVQEQVTEPRSKVSYVTSPKTLQPWVKLPQIKLETDKELQCSSCLKHFDKKSNFLRHLTSTNCTRAVLIHCAHCAYTALSKHAIVMHLRRKHVEYVDPVPRSQCPKCPRSFKCRGSLTYHLNNVCGVAPKFQCSMCHYAAKQKHRIKSHIASKHAFRGGPRLPRCVSQEVPAPDLDATRFTCQICMRSYKEKDALSRHLRDDCGKNSLYACTGCPRVYRQMRALARHVEFECNKLPQFACPHCDYRAKRKYTLTLHVAKKHVAAGQS